LSTTYIFLSVLINHRAAAFPRQPAANQYLLLQLEHFRALTLFTDVFVIIVLFLSTCLLSDTNDLIF